MAIGNLAKAKQRKLAKEIEIGNSNRNGKIIEISSKFVMWLT
jgi:hypothetical protein